MKSAVGVTGEMTPAAGIKSGFRGGRGDGSCLQIKGFNLALDGGMESGYDDS